jgi:phage terminase Nu1 subunit (DNA packaging protein)
VANPATYPVTTIAKLLMISERRVQQLTKDGVIPKAERGRYELAPAVQGYIKFLQERAIGKEVGTIDYNVEKARLVKLQADKAHLEVQELHRNLVDVGEVMDAWTSMLVDIKTKILTIPAMVSPVVATEDQPGVVQDLLDRTLRDALRDLSEYDQSKRTPNRGNVSTEATPEADRK